MAKKRKNKLQFFSKKFYLISGLILGVVVFIGAFNNKEVYCANSQSCINDLSGKFDPSQKEGEFMGQTVMAPSQIAMVPESEVVLGDSTSSNKHIYIDLTNQKLYAKEGDRIIYEFLISSGKWGRTPTGEFMTWIKLQSTRMKGGNKALGTFYNLPNVPYTMYFYGSGIPKSRGYGIHGAYWHNNFGHPMSHGCINMKPEEAGILYAWANPVSTGYTTYADKEHPGTPITIYGQAPYE